MYIENKHANNSSSTVTIASKVQKVSDLQFKEEYRNMVYSLGSAEYESLKQCISKEGVLIPLEINDKNEILDGNHRAQIAIELGLEFIPVIIRNFDTEVQENIFVIECNLERRQLNDYQKGELYHKLYQLDEEQDVKIRQLTTLKNVGNVIGPSPVSGDTDESNCNNSNENNKGRTREIIARKGGLSPATYARIVKIIDCAPELTKEKLRKGKARIYKEYTNLQSEEKRQELRAHSCAVDLPSGFSLINGDFREECISLADDSIDLIFTDPPYDRESLPLYTDLVKLAGRVLKPRGSLVTYIGNYYLPDTLERLNQDQGLKYLDQFIVKHNGISKRRPASNLRERYKSLLWFVKCEPGKGVNPITSGLTNDNLIERSILPDKSLHEWAQSPIEAEYIISHILFAENQVYTRSYDGLRYNGYSCS